MALTKSLRWEIQILGQRLAAAANMQASSLKAPKNAHHELELKSIIQAMKQLLDKIEDAVPLINLAITASGASLSTSLPSSVSPSRLLQASTFLTAGDAQYSISPSGSVQVGPTFILSMYMLFVGHLRPQNEEDIRESTWKEVIHKAVLKLVRVSINDLYNLPGSELPGSFQNASNGENSGQEKETEGYFHHNEAEAKSDEYAYQLVIVEDLEDDRLHTFEDNEPQPSSYDDIQLAGIREVIPIHEVSKIFYADTGKILNIGNEGEANTPVLLLKRDVNAVAPRRMMDRYGELGAQEYDGASSHRSNSTMETHRQHGSELQRDLSEKHGCSSLVSLPDPWRLPQDLDPEWIAFEVYTESAVSDSESEAESTPARPTEPSYSSRSPSMDPGMGFALSRLTLRSPTATATATPAPPSPLPKSTTQPLRPSLPPIRTSLSLLETLLRLLSLQQFQQAPHLAIPDELLTFFLSESASTGAAASDSQERKRLRSEARRRVGFDPYDESPVKRRGEEYQYRGAGADESYSYDNSGIRAASEDYEGFSPLNHEGYATPIRYSDEGYGTRNMSFPVHDRSRPSLSSVAGTPQTPPLLLNDRSSQSSPRSREVQPIRWRGGISRDRGRDLGADGEVMRRGSPLAPQRPRTGTADEGLGTSPASSNAAATITNISTGIKKSG